MTLADQLETVCQLSLAMLEVLVKVLKVILTVFQLEAASIFQLMIGISGQSFAASLMMDFDWWLMDLLSALRKTLLVEGNRTVSTRILVKNNNKMALCRYYIPSLL